MKIRCLSALLLIAWAGWAQHPPAPAPKLVCDEPTYHFGERDNTQDVEHTFVIRNEGNATLEIRRVRPSCGCTVANVSKNNVPPGDRTEISTRLSLRHREGPQHKILTVESNDPDRPSFTLTLEGTALNELSVRPTQVFFGRITTDAVVTGLVEIAVNTATSVVVTKLLPNATWLSVAVETNAPGRSYRVRITTAPPLPLGTVQGNVHLATDHPRYAAMDIGVSAFVVGTISVAPEVLVLPRNVEGPQTRFVFVRGETSQPFKILEAISPDPSLRVDVQETAPLTYRVVVSNIGTPEALGGKELVLRTDLPDRGEIRIPFRVHPAAE